METKYWRLEINFFITELNILKILKNLKIIDFGFGFVFPDLESLPMVSKGLWYLGNSNYFHVKELDKGYLHRSFLATTKPSTSFISRLASHWQHR